MVASGAGEGCIVSQILKSLKIYLCYMVKFSPASLFSTFCTLSSIFSQDGGTALLAACQYGHTKVVETLLKHGANVHDQLYVSYLTQII